MYETSVLIFNNLFTGNDFTQNIEWVDSKLNLKYDFLKCSWNSYCFKYKLAIVPEGMNIFHYLTAANLIAQFYLCSLYSLYFPIKGWRSLICISWECQEVKGWKEKPFGQTHCCTSARPNLAILDPQYPKRKPTTAWDDGYLFAFQASLSPWYKNINRWTYIYPN